MVCVIRRKGEHSRSLSRRRDIQWLGSTVCSEETTEAGLGLVLLSLLFVLVLVKYAFDPREQGPPFLRNQGTGVGCRGLGSRSGRRVTLCRRLDEVHLGLFCGGFYDRSGCRDRREVNTIGECRGILSSLWGMIELRYCGIQRRK